MKFKSNFLREINSRGFIYQSSDIDYLDDLMSKKKITAYIGFDITSDSLHIGSLVQLMLCLLYTSPSPRDGLLSRMPSSA